MNLKPLFWKGIHGRGKKKSNEGIESHRQRLTWVIATGFLLQSLEELHPLPHPTKKRYNRKGDYWWREKEEKDLLQRTELDVSPTPGESSARWENMLHKTESLNICYHNKQTNFFAEWCGLKDGSAKTWVFVKNIDFQASSWALGICVFNQHPRRFGDKNLIQESWLYKNVGIEENAVAFQGTTQMSLTG